MVNVYNPTVVEVALRYENNVDASSAHNVFHFTTAEPMSTGVLADLADAMESWIDVEWQPIASLVWKSTGIGIRQLKADAPLTYDRTWSYTGAITGAAPANNVTFAVSFRTGFGGRSYRGRAYHVGLAEADIADSYIDLTVKESIREAYEAIIALADDKSWIWGVYSKWLNKVPREVGLLTPITSVITVDNILDSMRTRLPGH